MNDNDLRLRPFRIFDSPFMSNGLRDEVILKANGLSEPISSSWLFVWWWIKKTFVITYCIECDSRRIGFVGLHDLRLGESTEITMVLFDSNIRGLGYGSRVFTLLSQNLKKYSIAEKVIAQVKIHNSISLSFLRKLGFVEEGISGNIVTLSLHLKSLRF